MTSRAELRQLAERVLDHRPPPKGTPDGAGEFVRARLGDKAQEILDLLLLLGKAERDIARLQAVSTDGLLTEISRAREHLVKAGVTPAPIEMMTREAARLLAGKGESHDPVED